MATKYKFSCSNCNYQVQLTVGLTKIQHYRKDKNVELASCGFCKTLSTTNNKLCPNCNTKAETGKWFSKKTGFKILDIRTNDNNIICPKCDFKYIKVMPIAFID
ncbi:hypothetical protein [Pedobacter sp.]|uniref:hypothetical protein n=1 Tax=Pedobacter sp. TaxID=1411316 RepID=UPI003BAC85E1